MSRLRSQRGMALPIALGMLMVLAIVAGTVVAVGLTNETSTRRANSDQRAFALAEAGLEQAVATLHAAYDPFSTTAVPAGSQPEDGGTMSWSGSLSGTTWTLTGTGAMPGENGAGTITRTASAQYHVSVVGTPWEYTFADAVSGCMTINNNADIVAKLFVRGNLCLDNNARYTASKLHVSGTLTMAVNARIGAAGTPIAEANLVGGCTGGSPNPHTCTSADKVYASSITQTPNSLAKPTVDLDFWYANARPGPQYGCTSGTMPGGFDTDGTRNNSRPVFDLTPAAAYSCSYVVGSTTVGQLTWNPGSKTITIAGVIYFDGPIVASGDAVYSGRGTIYSSGTVTLDTNAEICGITGCTSSWDPNANLMMLVAGTSSSTIGFRIWNGAVYQGAAYVVNDYLLENNAVNWGPVVARQITISQNADQNTPLIALTPGAPGVIETIHPVAASWRG